MTEQLTLTQGSNSNSLKNEGNHGFKCHIDALIFRFIALHIEVKFFFLGGKGECN
jgi:hypothetical protein